MTRVVAIIFHPPAPSDAGPLERAFAEMRRLNAGRQATGFRATGAEATVVEVEPGGAPFGARLRAAREAHPRSGLVVLGSGSIPLATRGDRKRLVTAARAHDCVATNSRYSADVLALPAGMDLADLPDVASDNAIPRWFADRGVRVVELPGRRRLAFDLDSPLDGLVAGAPFDTVLDGAGVDVDRVRTTIERLREVARDPRAQLVVAGRTSARTLRWLERRTASRTRALIEERGMRTAPPGQRPPRSILGRLLDDRGPGALASVLGELADGAIVDSRVLLAHRLGVDDSRWPRPEDRFASDLLVPDGIADPWLRELTASAASAPLPVLLSGHTVVGPGLPRLLRGERR